MIDKEYCMSSYLTFRFIEDDNCDFAEGIKHFCNIEIPKEKIVKIHDEDDVANVYQAYINRLKNKKIGILLSGGMDSACLASFLPKGTDAYTFDFKVEGMDNSEKARAKYYADRYELNLHYVDINWSTVEKNIDKLLNHKGAPVHSIEPQLMEAAIKAKEDGCEVIFVGGGDVALGGLSKMLSKEWQYDEWVDFFTFLSPETVLKKPVSMDYVFRRYMLPGNKVDYVRFMNEVFAREADCSYCNAFTTAGFDYDPSLNPSEILQLDRPLDLERIRAGESKYIVRLLFRKRYPNCEIPEKIPMPRPVDIFFKDWKGPTRPEFKTNLDMSMFTGNQKWQMWCLERFLNSIENK